MIWFVCVWVSLLLLHFKIHWNTADILYSKAQCLVGRSGCTCFLWSQAGRKTGEDNQILPNVFWYKIGKCYLEWIHIKIKWVSKTVRWPKFHLIFKRWGYLAQNMFEAIYLFNIFMNMEKGILSPKHQSCSRDSAAAADAFYHCCCFHGGGSDGNSVS